MTKTKEKVVFQTDDVSFIKEKLRQSKDETIVCKHICGRTYRVNIFKTIDGVVKVHKITRSHFIQVIDNNGIKDILDLTQ